MHDLQLSFCSGCHKQAFSRAIRLTSLVFTYMSHSFMVHAGLFVCVTRCEETRCIFTIHSSHYSLHHISSTGRQHTVPWIFVEVMRRKLSLIYSTRLYSPLLSSTPQIRPALSNSHPSSLSSSSHLYFTALHPPSRPPFFLPSFRSLSCIFSHLLGRGRQLLKTRTPLSDSGISRVYDPAKSRRRRGNTLTWLLETGSSSMKPASWRRMLCTGCLTRSRYGHVDRRCICMDGWTL